MPPKHRPKKIHVQHIPHTRMHKCLQNIHTIHTVISYNNGEFMVEEWLGPTSLLVIQDVFFETLAFFLFPMFLL
jgi:hypothetical protein